LALCFVEHHQLVVVIRKALAKSLLIEANNIASAHSGPPGRLKFFFDDPHSVNRVQDFGRWLTAGALDRTACDLVGPKGRFADPQKIAAEGDDF
jgi:hypothetical protein